ncbi:MAG: NAD(P)-dependent oxidoreductase [Clostridiales bacterium]
MSKILITGGNGFIGSHIVEYFENNGHEIICLIRKTSDIKYIEGLKVKFIYADISKSEDLKKLNYNNTINNVDYVIHNSSKVVDWGDYKDFYSTNVSGSLNLIKILFEKGIKNFIVTSSISVYGEENSLTIKNEESKMNSHYKYFLDNVFPCGMNYYRDTKKLEKKKIIELAEINKLNVTFIEPIWVYGEREFCSGFYEYLSACKMGIPFMMGSKKNKFHVIYVKDLVRAYYLTYIKRLEGVNSIIVGNNKAENMNMIYEKFCREAKIKKPINIPKVFTYPVGFFLELIYTFLKIKKPPVLTRGRVNMFYDNIEYSTKRAKQILDFQSEVSLEEGVKRTIKWYKENGFL